MSLSPQKVDFEKIWAGLQEGVAKIVTLTGVKGMPMIEDIYKLCTAQPQPYSEDLYLRLKQFLEVHVDSLREDIAAQQGDLLADYLKKWETFATGSEYCHHIFRYLNNNWIRKRLEDSRNKLGGLYQGPSSTTEVYEVFTLALVIWKDHVFVKVQDRLLRSLLELLTKERDGELINSTVVAGVIQSFVKLGSINKNKPLEIYKDDFEAAFLESTREYYARESGAYIASNGVSSYMKKAKERLEEEANRAKKYLDSSSYDKLKRECDTVLIEKHKEVMQVECENYLKDDKRDDLSRMYHLLSRIPDGIAPMLEVLQTHVTKFGFDAVKGIPAASVKDPVKYVNTLLEVYTKFSDVVKTAFENDPAFVAALDKAMRQIVNDNPINKKSTKSPELLAKYSDFLLSKSNKNFEYDKLDDTLNQVLVIFKYVDDKDVFQKFYSKMLARRLIHGTSISDDAESAMIGGLKQACGYEYTSKLQRMFNDMALSNDINEKFKEYLESKALNTGNVDFSILVLTAGSWPLTAQVSSFNGPRGLWFDWIDSQRDLIGPDTVTHHNWIGSGAVCVAGPNNTETWWATLILVGVCHAPYFGYELPHYDDYMCCNATPACPAAQGHDVLLLVNNTNSKPSGSIEAVCCSTSTLTGAREVPPSPATETGTASITIPLTQGSTGRLCYCMSHNINSPANVSGAHFHWGKATQQAESLVVHTMEPPYASPFDRCWAYGDDGLCPENIVSGALYMNMHTNVSDATPGLNGWIRDQLACRGFEHLSFHSGLLPRP